MSTCTDGLAYADLSDEAKKKAVEWWQEQAREEYPPFLHDTLGKDLSEHYGVTNCELFYGLGCCQGDGVAFEGNPDLDHWADHDPELQAKLAGLILWCVAYHFEVPHLCVVINQDGRYTHWNSMNVTVEPEWEDDFPGEGSFAYELVNDIESYLDDAVKTISRKLEKTGYDEIEYHQSEEMAIEVLEGGDCRFDEDGDIL